MFHWKLYKTIIIILISIIFSCQKKACDCEQEKTDLLTTFELSDDYTKLSIPCDSLHKNPLSLEKVEYRKSFHFVNNPYQLNRSTQIEIYLTNLSLPTTLISKDTIQARENRGEIIGEYESYKLYQGSFKETISALIPPIKNKDRVEIIIEARNLCHPDIYLSMTSKGGELIWDKESRQVSIITLPSKGTSYFFNNYW